MGEGQKGRAPPLQVSWSWKGLRECLSIREAVELPEASIHPDLMTQLPLS